MKAKKTWYLDKNRELTDDEEKAAFVLINEGQDISPAMQKKYFSPEKKSAGPSEDKSAAPTKTKKTKKK